MNRYYLKIKTLSPIHIGTGEVYEPTNFVIDNGYLYEFDEVLFYKSLDDLSKKSFNTKLNDLFQLISFYKKNENMQKAKEIFYHKVKVSKEIENRYINQFNKDGSLNRNQLDIEKTYKEPNTNLAIIPGSSLKGVLDTVLKIYAKPEVASNEIRQKLKLSDTIPINIFTEIGIAKRVHKNPNKKAKSKIPINIEIIREGSEFIFTMTTEFTIQEILKNLNSFYNSPKRKNTYFHISNNSFVMRLGKFSGKPFVVYNPYNIKNSYGKDIATHTVYNNKEFGWIEIENISKNEYLELLEKYEKLRLNIVKERKLRQINIKTYIEQKEEKEKLDKKQQELEKQKKLQEAKEQKEKDFKEAKDTNDIEYLEKFILKYQSEDIDFAKKRLEVVKQQQKENKLHSLEQKAKSAYDELLKKKGTKAFVKAKEKFIKKWSKEKENKGSKVILDLVDKVIKLKG
jgi:hypothetical protein